MWRFRGSAMSFSERMASVEGDFDLVVASDHTSLAEFLAFQRKRFPDTATACFVHENRLNEALRNAGAELFQLALNSINNAHAADAVFLPTEAEKRSFTNDLRTFVEQMPDHRPRESTLASIENRCHVLPVGMDLQELDQWQHMLQYDSPTILWNHHWSAEKDPDTFFRALFQLADEGFDFGVVVCGEPHGERPSIFEEAQQVLGDRIFHYGFVASRGEYANLLWMSDVVVSTATQESFPISVAEAIYCHCYPLLPRRLSYPYLLPQEHHDLHLYADFEDLMRKLRHAVTSPLDIRSTSLRDCVTAYDWDQVIAQYDLKFAEIATYKDTLHAL